MSPSIDDRVLPAYKVRRATEPQVRPKDETYFQQPLLLTEYMGVAKQREKEDGDGNSTEESKPALHTGRGSNVQILT